jgi:hypothetical protein
MLPPRVLVERKYALALFQLNAAAPESCLLSAGWGIDRSQFSL